MLNFAALRKGVHYEETTIHPFFVIRVNEFNQHAVTPLEEWMQYLKDEYIKPDTTVPGLREARERLEYLRMTPQEQQEYDDYWDTFVRDTDVIKTQILEAEIKGRKEGLEKGMAKGLEEGRKEGMAKGMDEARKDNARRMKADGLPTDLIAKYTGLSVDEIVSL